MAKKVPDRDVALVRVAHLAAVMKIPVNGDQAVALAEFHIKEPRAEALMVRAGKIARAKGVKMDGGDLLRMVRFLA